MVVVRSIETETLVTVTLIVPDGGSNQCVLPGRDVQDDVVALDVGGCPHGRPFENHIDPDKVFAGLCVFDLTGNLSCVPGDRGAQDAYGQEEEKQYTRVHTVVAPAELAVGIGE
jgi:hypothetical protein